MHIVNLGVDLWVAGSTFKFLLDFPPDEIWQGTSVAERLSNAYNAFRKFAREKKLQHLAFE